MMKPVLTHLLALVVSPLRANDPGGGAPGVGAHVTLTDNGSSVILANGEVSATITKDNAKFTAYTFRGVALTTSARQIYYSMDGGSSYRQPSGCTYTVKTNTPDMVDIGMRQTWTTQAQAVDIEIHYVLRRGDSGIYTYAILDHPDSYPATGFGEWRMVWKLPDNTFERLYVDDLRNRQMPTAADYAAASATSIAEILKLNTGVLAGQYEGKYCYNSNYRKNPVWGHATNDEDIGVWLVTGGHEFFNDGPMKQDLAPADRILHIHFGMNHYNGSSTAIAAGEAWRKLYGPFLLYCNHDPAVHPALVVTTSGDPAPDDDLDQLPDAWEAEMLSSLSFTGSSDPDNDLLPDAWELLHFTNLLQSAADDPDGDSTENHAEFTLDLDPADPNSRFTAAATSGHVIHGKASLDSPSRSSAPAISPPGPNSPRSQE